MFDKFVEIDHDEVVMRKVHAISSKVGLRDVLERGNETVVNDAQASISSPQFCLLPADLRDLGQARFLPLLACVSGQLSVACHHVEREFLESSCAWGCPEMGWQRMKNDRCGRVRHLKTPLPGRHFRSSCICASQNFLRLCLCSLTCAFPRECRFRALSISQVWIQQHPPSSCQSVF